MDMSLLSSILLLKNIIPGWCCSLDRALAPALKGCGFNSQLWACTFAAGAILTLVVVPVGDNEVSLTLFLSLSFLLHTSLPLSLESNGGKISSGEE